MKTGTIYGVVLNDSTERRELAAQFEQPPYLTPPRAPVLYIKPLTCLSEGGAAVPMPDGITELQASATIALTFSRDAARVTVADALATVGSARIAVDICIPTASYFRPAISERCRDGFLPAAVPTSPPASIDHLDIVTEIDGIAVHRWSLSRLVRPVGRLISDISAFMTLQAGDSLLIGLPGDAPKVSEGQTLRVAAKGFPDLTAHVIRELSN